MDVQKIKLRAQIRYLRNQNPTETSDINFSNLDIANCDELGKLKSRIFINLWKTKFPCDMRNIDVSNHY